MSASVLLLALTAAGAAHVSLDLTSVQEVLLVGEPLRLNLRFRAHREVAIPQEPGWESTAGVQVWIATGGGEREYFEYTPSVREELTIFMGPLRAGREASWDLLLHRGFHAPFVHQDPRLTFAEAGNYSVQMVWGRDGWQVRSNWLIVTVVEPEGEDRALLDELGRDVSSLKYGDSRARRLLERYPRSPYLHMTRVRAFAREGTAVWMGLDPETGLERPGVATLGPEELTRARQEGARRLARQLSAEPNWGAFEDMRVGFLERHARFSGDVETADRAARELRARYPYSPMTRALQP